MNILFEIFATNLKNLRYRFQRYLLKEISWKDRLIAITGARGVGKTTLILQYIKKNLQIDESVLYISLDNIYFQGNSLFDVADRFVKNGGKHLFVDEVHKYPNWAVEIKNIYDNFKDLRIVFTGSSILSIYKGFADLSRRAVSYSLHGLSFREYLGLEKQIDFPVLELDNILKNHINFSIEISSKIKPIAEFNNYLKYGYYPYFKESKETYHQKLANVINIVLENDLPAVNIIEYGNILKLKKLLYIIALSVPFKANITKLSERVGVSRNTMLNFLDYLRKAQIINHLTSSSKSYGYLTKPEKIYLNNTNIAFAITAEKPDLGNLRETFFLNQLTSKHKVNTSATADFLVDDKYTFEVGGKSKTNEQIKGIGKSFLVKDDIEVGYKNSIPLWLFGFLY
jgi:predicted AAA+ superfamily ATPase